MGAVRFQTPPGSPREPLAACARVRLPTLALAATHPQSSVVKILLKIEYYSSNIRVIN